MSLIKTFRNQQGQTLIEAIIALAIVSLVITAVVIAVVTGLNNSNSSGDRSEALGYAEEALDYMRDLKTENFGTFTGTYTTSATNANNYWCMSEDGIIEDEASAVIDCRTQNNIDGKYRRRVYIDSNGENPSGTQQCNNGIYASSIVTWSDSTCRNNTNCRNVELTTCFYNLQSIN